MASIPPLIFSPTRRLAVRRRLRAASKGPDTATYVIDDMVGDVLERLAFLRFKPKRSLVIGDWSYRLAAALDPSGADVIQADPHAAFDQLAIDEERPIPFAKFDFIASLGTLDTVNDLPGALIHLRNALNPGGLVLASFVGAGSLPNLRAAMLAADGDRPAPRLHPAVDVRGGGQLLQRAGWGEPVVDSRSLPVRYSNLASLVADLRTQGLSNCLARSGPPLTRAQLTIANQCFGSATVDSFEILTLTGWHKKTRDSP